MAALTTLTRIQLIAGDDSFIQGLNATDPVVEMILDDVDRHIKVEDYGSDTEAAQRYCAAHWLSISNQPVGGRGPLSSVSIGGISRSFTLPYLNRKEVYGATQFGLQYMEFVRRNVFAFRVIIPALNVTGLSD